MAIAITAAVTVILTVLVAVYVPFWLRKSRWTNGGRLLGTELKSHEYPAVFPVTDPEGGAADNGAASKSTAAQASNANGPQTISTACKDNVAGACASPLSRPAGAGEMSGANENGTGSVGPTDAGAGEAQSKVEVIQ